MSSFSFFVPFCPLRERHQVAYSLILRPFGHCPGPAHTHATQQNTNTIFQNTKQTQTIFEMEAETVALNPVVEDRKSSTKKERKRKREEKKKDKKKKHKSTAEPSESPSSPKKEKKSKKEKKENKKAKKAPKKKKSKISDDELAAPEPIKVVHRFVSFTATNNNLF